MNASHEMPRYRSHKIVWALKIGRIDPLPNPDTTGRSAAASYGATITPTDEGYGPFEVPDTYMTRHNPQPGGYFVRYADGYTSFSPAEAFEEGNTPIPAAPRLSMDFIESRIASEHYFTAEDGVGRASKGQTSDFGKNPAGLSQLTFCVLVLRNGTKVVGINHGSIDPNQHSAEQGRTSARAAAVEQIWQLEGYLLRQLVAGN